MANKKNPTTNKDEKEKKTSSTKKTATEKKTTTKKNVKTSEAKTSKTPKKTTTSSAKKTTTGTKTKTASKKSTSTKKATTSAKKTTTKSKTSTKKTQAPKKEVTSAIENETVETKPLILEDVEVNANVEVATEEKSDVIENNREERQSQNYAKTILGGKIPAGNSSKDRKKRRTYYVLDSIMFATILPILDLFMMMFCPWYTSFLSLDSTQNCIIVLVLDFIIVFIATYLIDFAATESAVKKINKTK